jgi:23S rRNA G2445 N2-methylase RlmL
MHQRGYRLQAGDAPLREDLAALLVMLTRHDAKSEALIDPLGGSGTIVVEAACLARTRPVWMSGRTPDAARHPLFGALPRPKPLFADTLPVLFAAEIDSKTQAIMKKTFATAGVEREVEILGGDFATIDPAELLRRARERGMERGVVLSNPPYGERLQHDRAELRRLYRQLGQWCRELRGWRAGFLVANEDFADCFGGRPRVVKPLKNGPIRARFYLYDNQV